MDPVAVWKKELRLIESCADWSRLQNYLNGSDTTFRKSLFEKYHGRCIITGINHPNLLVASHIKPWAVSSNKERLSVDNGLLLSATYDRLFDSGLITFDRQGKIFLSSLIGEENVKRLNLSKDMRFDLCVRGNMGEYLDYHNDIVFVK